MPSDWTQESAAVIKYLDLFTPDKSSSDKASEWGVAVATAIDDNAVRGDLGK